VCSRKKKPIRKFQEAICPERHKTTLAAKLPAPGKKPEEEEEEEEEEAGMTLAETQKTNGEVRL